MDDSQSSDFLSSSIDYSRDSPGNMNPTVPYDALIMRTKNYIRESLRDGVPKPLLSHFTSLLEDCSSCISQSLDLIVGLLVDSEVPYSMLTEYMEHAVSLLQMLSNYLNTVVESVTMSCYTMKTFPVTTGNIVMAVFTHCKDSESLYGRHIKCVERQLKDLFKTCHELQLTYLTVLEKHFTFDLTVKEEQDILIQALDINLTIGEIVQTLDVKTMAEQWKAYTIICEKHSTFLSDKNIFLDCTRIICNMSINNITTAVEADQEDKIVLRSLKIASFIIKILIKLYGIFKSVSKGNCTNVLDLFIFIKKYNSSYLELVLKKSNLFINQITAIVFNPLDLFFAELVTDKAFLECCLEYNIDTPKSKEEMLGFIQIVASAIEIMLNKNDQIVHTFFMHKIIKKIFEIVPKCHILFNLGLKFASTKSQKQRSHGLYEHLLIHTIALATTLSSEDYLLLEQVMYEALLGTDCWTALFASDLWVALSGNNRQLLIDQFDFLCKTYHKLESNKKLFFDSPQKVHLSYTIARLFKAMKVEDKIRLYNKYNLSLWTPLEIKHTPPEVQEKAVEDTINDLLPKFDKTLLSGIQSEDEIRQMCNLMKASATCRFVDGDETFEDYVIKVWFKSCPKDRIIPSLNEMDKGYLWYLEYIEALVTLTKSMKILLKDDEALVKILHVMLNIAQLENTELDIALLELLCQVSLQMSDENKNQLEFVMTHTYRCILQKNDTLINNILFRTLKNYKNHKNFEYVVSLLFSLDNSLQATYRLSLFQNTNHINDKHWRDHLMTLEDYLYTHKCVENANVIELCSSGSSRELKENSKNFDFADIDSLFGGESDSDQPLSKKAKLTNKTRIEEVISRLEKDSSLLCCEKENVFSNEDISRISAVCNRLKNIID